MRDWLTDQAIIAIFDKLAKGAIRISGLDPKERDLVIWVSEPGSRKSLKKDSCTRHNKK